MSQVRNTIEAQRLEIQRLQAELEAMRQKPLNLAYEQRRDIILQAVNVGHAIDLTEAAHGIKKE